MPFTKYGLATLNNESSYRDENARVQSVEYAVIEQALEGGVLFNHEHDLGIRMDVYACASSVKKNMLDLKMTHYHINIVINKPVTKGYFTLLVLNMQERI